MSGAAQCHELPDGGRVLFCDRNAGNLSSVSGDGAGAAARARERLRERAGLRLLARGRQVHGSAVARVVGGGPDEAPHDASSRAPGGPRARDWPDELEADGQATAMTGVGVMVLTADCLPVALGCAGAVAMLHAGWRGLSAGVLEEGVRALRELSPGQEIAAVIGPGAGVCCYEVGAEVHAALSGEERAGAIDLSAIARERLLHAGAARVHELRACTICDERFFSHRREGARAGRQAGVAWLT